MRSLTLGLFIYGCLLISSFGLDGNQDTKNPAIVIEELQATLVDVMKHAKELGYSGRYGRLAPIIQSTHALSKIAKVAVGRHWRQFDAEQKTLLVEAFSDFCIANYASMFDGYSGEQFTVKDIEQQRPGRSLVRTSLVKSNGEEINLDYVLSQHDGSWKIVNISTNGISDLALKRAEYTSVLDKEGFNVLLAKLTQKVIDFSEVPKTSWNDEQIQN